MPKASRKKNRKRRRKKRAISRSKARSPTTLSIFPEKSPQLQGSESSPLNLFTTKNVVMGEGQNWNAIENGKLAYKRPARGADISHFPRIIYGPRVERLTKTNYRRLKKGSKLYYDRSSVVYRGPFTFQRLLRGPILLLTAQDMGYKDLTYKFTLPVKNLKKEMLYLVTKSGKSRKAHTSRRRKSVKRKRRTKR